MWQQAVKGGAGVVSLSNHDTRGNQLVHPKAEEGLRIIARIIARDLLKNEPMNSSESEIGGEMEMTGNHGISETKGECVHP